MDVSTNTYGAVTVVKDRHGTQTIIGGDAVSIPAYLTAFTEGQILGGRKTHEEAWTEAHRAVTMAQINQSSLRSAR